MGKIFFVCVCVCLLKEVWDGLSVNTHSFIYFFRLKKYIIFFIFFFSMQIYYIQNVGYLPQSF